MLVVGPFEKPGLHVTFESVRWKKMKISENKVKIRKMIWGRLDKFVLLNTHTLRILV